MAVLEDYDLEVSADDDFDIGDKELEERGLDKYDVE